TDRVRALEDDRHDVRPREELPRRGESRRARARDDRDAPPSRRASVRVGQEKISLAPASVSTAARRRLMITTLNRRLPKYDPAVPPTTATPAIATPIDGNARVAAKLPVSPASEFTRMNTALAADAIFVGAQRRRISTGVRKIPPPVPVSPA